MLIVAVDNGYGNMKTASCAFPTGLTVYEEKPYFTENLLVYHDRYYIIGSGHKEFAPQKITDEDNYVLTLAAVARELDHQKITSGKVLLATGLPLTWMVSQQEGYRRYLMQNKLVDVNFRGVDYHIELVDTMIFPQGYAAIADRLGDFKGVNILADIGNGTVNLLRVIDRRADVSSMATEACGVKDCAIAMRTALANQHGGAKVDDSIIERIIRTGTAQIDSGYLQTLTEAAGRYTQELLRKFREYGYDPKTMRLYVVGGGGCLLRNFGSINTDRVTINSDLHANARGYEFLAYELLRKMGVVG
jgi:plasmid segregation protein ParM